MLTKLAWRYGIATLALALSMLPALASCEPVTGVSADTIEANDTDTLRKNVGQEITVRGRVESTGRSRSGYQFLNFAEGKLTGICYPDDVRRFSGGNPADLFRDKSIELTGKVELYEGKLQIRLRTPSQIRIVTRNSPPTNGVKLKLVGQETWLSPAGLRYHGRDPAGRTRVEHIERHVKDQPSRDGPHGVFDGGRDITFGVIDEAWRLAQERKIRPKKEGDRSSLTVSMGRRVGYLGGRDGAAKKNPPLDRVFIVFKTGTKDIITAFPK